MWLKRKLLMKFKSLSQMNDVKLPICYQAVVLEAYHKNIVRAMLSLRVVEKRIDFLPADKVLVKIDAATCNPSDIAFMQSSYQVVKKLPAIPGFEASGRILAVGKNIAAEGLLGKRVSCFSQSDESGTWAEYALLGTHEFLVHDQQLTLQQSTGFFVNPFTAFGLFELVQNHKSKAVVINAAGSVLAVWLSYFAKQKGIKTIGIVRKKETAEKLSGQYWDKVFVSNDENFGRDFRQYVHEFESLVAFDAVGAEMTGQLVNSLPVGSIVVVYGGLSGKFIEKIDPLSLIFREITLKGFNLNYWLKHAPAEKVNQVANEIAGLFIKGQIKTKVQIEVGMQDIVKGLRTYLGDMSAGKILIRF